MRVTPVCAYPARMRNRTREEVLALVQALAAPRPTIVHVRVYTIRTGRPPVAQFRPIAQRYEQIALRERKARRGRCRALNGDGRPGLPQTQSHQHALLGVDHSKRSDSSRRMRLSSSPISRLNSSRTETRIHAAVLRRLHAQAVERCAAFSLFANPFTWGRERPSQMP